MAISKSYTFTNGTTIDPDEVNQNFDDVLDEIKGAHHSDVDGTLILPADINASWGLVPIGGIIMWSGLISAIPAGYSFCNGTGGTVDMRNKFAICSGQDSGGTFDTGDTGGALTINIAHTHTGPSHKHTVPSHNHSYSGTTEQADAEVSADTGGSQRTDIYHKHTYSGTTGTVEIVDTTYAGAGATGSALSSSQSILPPYRATVYIQLTN